LNIILKWYYVFMICHAVLLATKLMIANMTETDTIFDLTTQRGIADSTTAIVHVSLNLSRT